MSMHSVAGAVVLSSLAIGLTLTAAEASQADRAKQCLTKGDADTSQRISRNVVKAAIAKWKIADLANDQAIKNAESELYGFLKWKLGNPAAICAQYVTADTQHFIKAYGDEAAAALLGFDLPNEKGGHSMFYLPPELIKLWVMTEKLKNVGKAYVLNAVYGIPKSLTKQVLDTIVDEEAKVMKRLGFNIPKNYDFPNELVEFTILARRNPQAAQKRVGEAVAKAPAK